MREQDVCAGRKGAFAQGDGRGWQEGGAGDTGQAACLCLGGDVECVLCKAAEVLG